jgi:hypothetical protein
MNHAKLRLSAEEMRLALNKDLILTKREVIKKVCQMMGMLSEQMQNHLIEMAGILPAEIISSTPKISKGEQYKEMPYVVLDYPRFFSKENVFAIRTFFWWGHYFSSTLQLKGSYQKKYSNAILSAVVEGRLNDYELSVSGDEFDFDLLAGNYQKANSVETFTTIDKNYFEFVKISRAYSINKWDEVPYRLFEDFKKYIDFCKAD